MHAGKRGGRRKEQPSAEALAEEQELKEAGNASFKAGKYDDAIAQYTLALRANATNAVLFSNRAQAFIKVSLQTNLMIPAMASSKPEPLYMKPMPMYSWEDSKRQKKTAIRASDYISTPRLCFAVVQLEQLREILMERSRTSSKCLQ